MRAHRETKLYCHRPILNDMRLLMQWHYDRQQSDGWRRCGFVSIVKRHGERGLWICRPYYISDNRTFRRLPFSLELKVWCYAANGAIHRAINNTAEVAGETWMRATAAVSYYMPAQVSRRRRFARELDRAINDDPYLFLFGYDDDRDPEQRS